MVRVAAFALVLAACTKSPSGGGGDDSTTHVFHIEIPLDTKHAGCIEGTLVDIDPNTPGDQYECNVWFRFTDASEQTLDPCDGTVSNKPCWHLLSAVGTCPLGGMLAMTIETAPPAAGTVAVAECLGK